MTKLGQVSEVARLIYGTYITQEQMSILETFQDESHNLTQEEEEEFLYAEDFLKDIGFTDEGAEINPIFFCGCTLFKTSEEATKINHFDGLMLSDEQKEEIKNKTYKAVSKLPEFIKKDMKPINYYLLVY